MENRYCVIMCGGIGSRFWPFSKAARPKQFLDFFGTGRSLLQMTYDRVSNIIPVRNILAMTNEKYAPLVKEQLPELSDDQILLEPDRRNTAPCIAWAAYHIRAINPNAVMLVSPSDHLILREDVFKDCVTRGLDFVARYPYLLTMGIQPNRPETGYGYIQMGKEEIDGFSRVKTFTEKPDFELAKVFVESGEFAWNSGIFLWGVNTIIDSIHEHVPDIAMRFDKGLGKFGTEKEMAFIKKEFPACPNISIDYAVMEKEKNVFVQRADFGWSDVGSWGAFYEKSPKTETGNVIRNCKTVLSGCENNIFAAKQEKLVVASGLKDYIVVDDDDILLICPLSEEQKIKQYVNEVKANFGDEYL
ncbi:MAG: mannose-1-phosphate guanylyltransferase [Bacteroidetes bacterium]|uniref:mannose-1-phosphate guanylyltransferase n=1 Tax=Candidatus Limisoma faecipullorum TaxID=2840854 RepID=A0A9D9IS20_9BACT|nr:mannose-1-phosphate guanylyltransferase [Candidatus Limisoma faecipullorum]